MNIAVNPLRWRDDCEVAIIGAGPYGLAVAAHLRAANVPIRIFGDAMAFWRENMPEGMKLRSPWIATHIAEPRAQLTLDEYFAAAGLEIPKLLPVERFIDYGLWFQQRVAPDLDGRKITRVEPCERGFRLSLEDGDTLIARRVVMATGLRGHEYRPAEFAGLPRALVSHSCEHTDSTRYRGKHVAVVGRGQSACESAALLHEAGAEVELICRGDLVWNADPGQRSTLRKAVRSLLGNMLIPPSQVGPFPFNWLNEAPGIVRRLPRAARNRVNEQSLRATAVLWLRPRLQGVRVNGRRKIAAAQRIGDEVALTFDYGVRCFDHVLLGTGYRIDVDKMGLLDRRLRERIARRDGLPILTGGMESSVPGLHFVGAAAVGSFGPLLRFIAGAGFAARRVTRAALRGGARQSTGPALVPTAQPAALPVAADAE
jgi:thioredoxin reductase